MVVDHGVADRDERVLWVTGGGSGMGAAAAQAAAATGWTVVLSGRREEQLAQVAEQVRADGGAASVLPLDVQEADAILAARDRVLAEHGRIDALVLTGVASMVDAALPALRESGGVVVVISSFAGWSFQPGAGVAYSASKTALGSLVRTLNQQEAPHGVRATHLCPGDVASDFLEQRPEVPGAEARAVMLTPEDIGRAVEFVVNAPPYVRVDELVISPVSQR
jgi:NADP-dependent 3-hydroxy acid dehydrogenase YdfG